MRKKVDVEVETVKVKGKDIPKKILDCIIEVWGDPPDEVTGFFASQFVFTKTGDKYIANDIIKQFIDGRTTFEALVTIMVEAKSLGIPKKELVKGEIMNERVDEVVDLSLIDKEVYAELSEDEKELLYGITIWEAYDKLIDLLTTGEKKGTEYFGVLQQIYNRIERKTRPVQTYKTVEKPDLEGVDIDVYVNGKLYHLYEGKKIDCGDKYLRHYVLHLNKWEFFI